MKNKAAKLKSKRKGNENAFCCDLTEHLQNSGQDGKFLFSILTPPLAIHITASPSFKSLAVIISLLYYEHTPEQQPGPLCKH